MLNESQEKAVLEIQKPCIIIAGPGTGKTTLITEKIKHLIDKEKVNGDRILAITFTRKAAQEMSERVEILTGKPFFAKTFHEFALEIIDDYQKDIPQIDRSYTLIDEASSLVFFLENLSEFNLSSIEVKNNHALIANELYSEISKLKDFGIRLNDLEKMNSSDFSVKMDVFLAYSKYELYKKENNFLDFADLLLHVKELLEKNPKIRSEIKEKYSYVLVDEFQDTNKVQFEILKLISKKNNITIVGDQKQSIYSFRGANYENLALFKRHFAGYEEIYLHDNYRCSNRMMGIINRLIENNDEILNSERTENGEVNLIEASNESSQLNYIVEKILKIKNDCEQKGKKKSVGIGILFRKKHELKLVANTLKNLNIPFNSNEINNLFEYDVVKDILNEIRIVINPRRANNELFKLLLEMGVSNEVVKKLTREASLKEKSLYEIIKKEDFKDEFYLEDRSLILKNISNIDELILLKNSKTSIYSFTRELIFKLNHYKYALVTGNYETISVLNKFLSFALNYSNIYKNNDLPRFLKVCSYSQKLEIEVEDGNENKEASNKTDSLVKIELLTIHASKGKEFDYVIMPFLNERRFPGSFKRNKFDVMERDSKEDFLSEEKRLFFVSVSRAKDCLDLIYVKRYGENKTDSNPSVFLNSLNLDRKIYTKEFDEFKMSKEDEIKAEVIENIKRHILNNEFGKAKDEIDMLNDIFGKRKDLGFFIRDSNGGSKKKYYNDKLNGKEGLNKEDVDFDEKGKIYSVSQLGTYRDCPKKYLYGYIYKIPSKSKHYFDFGTSMHSVFENLVDDISKYDGKKVTKETLFAKGASLMSKSWVSKGYEDHTQEKDYYEKGLQAIRDFIDTEIELQKKDKREVVCKEKKFLINVEGKSILGFIDRIDKVGNGFEIMDYKTSNSMETKTKLRDNMQLFVYSLAMKEDEDFGKYPLNVGLWYVIHNKIVSVPFSEINMSSLKEEMLELISGIESKNFKAKPSHFSCKFCDYDNICDKK